jgi:hypothetical protein
MPDNSAVFPATSRFHSQPSAVSATMLFGPVLVTDTGPVTACSEACPLAETTSSMLTPVVELAGLKLHPPA